MSIKFMNAAFAARVGNPIRKLILVKLCDNASDEGYCFPSIQNISYACEASKRSVIRHISDLEELGLLKKTNRYKDGSQTSNEYVLCFQSILKLVDKNERQRVAHPVTRSHPPSDIQSPVLCHTVNPPMTECHTNHHLTVNEPSIEPIVSSKLPTCPHAEILKIYSQTLPGLIQPKIWDTTREQLLKSRWHFLLTNKKTNGDPYATDKDSAIRWLTGFFEYIAKSDFLMGNVETDRPFKADLVWILKPANFAKIIEGKYHTRNGS